MDISKASNFERYVFDRVGRDGARVRDLYRRLDSSGEFDLPRSDSEFVSGRSTHADRLRTIKQVYDRFDVMIDPHTADGAKVGLEKREAGIALICLETAQPAKFAATLREALGREPHRPKGFENLENLPQRFTVMERDATAIKRYIEQHGAA